QGRKTHVGGVRRILPAHDGRDHDSGERRPGRGSRHALVAEPPHSEGREWLPARGGEQRLALEEFTDRQLRDGSCRWRRPGTRPLAGRLLLRVRRSTHANRDGSTTRDLRTDGKGAKPGLSLLTPCCSFT